ncbi:MAG: Stp1/IreP family PP2C-type Ser/Thr phosphatase [bacterium]|nr:Stp1/IreP family PP2C-type Ser/Thr phosphatase [bacterium]
MTTTRLGPETGPLAPLTPETRLADRYRIERFLEYKNGANLYRALDEATGLVIILKECEDTRTAGGAAGGAGPDATVAKSDWAEAATDNPWQSEFVILRSVSYPTVVKALDVFKASDRAYLVLEQLEGRDLAYVLRTRTSISVQQSLDWILQLAMALAQLHRRQIVHLDLQPRYLVVTPDGQRIRMTGFHRSRVLPAAGTVEGSPGYSPPEQFGYFGTGVDERADLYALGAVWHYLLTGNPPESYWNLDTERFNFPDVSAFVPTIHPQIERIVRRMIEPHPDDRFESIQEVITQLQTLLNNPQRLVGHCSDVGLLRQGNEDSLAVFDLSFTTQSNTTGVGLYIVADGMGGVNAGEVASGIAVDAITAVMQEAVSRLADDAEPGRQIQDALQNAVKEANTRIYETGRLNRELAGMGTTVTAALVFGQTVHVGHVGDSRAYLINRSGIEKISRDHSLVGRLIEIGQITPEQAATHPQRNLIYRSLGTYPNVEVDIYQRQFKIGDWLLLCSDGLTGHLLDEELMDVVLQTADPNLAARKLVNLANQRGGEDNITVVLVNLAEYS